MTVVWSRPNAWPILGRQIGEFAAQIHGDLPGLGQRPGLAGPRSSSTVVSKYSAVAAMIAAVLICMAAASEIRSRSTISASDLSIGVLFSEAKAVTRISAPSSSRMLRSMLLAMSFEHVVGNVEPIHLRLLRRIAMRVSSSGGWTSVIRPHSNRVRSRSSRVASCLGGRSEEMTICLFALCSVLKCGRTPPGCLPCPR